MDSLVIKLTAVMIVMVMVISGASAQQEDNPKAGLHSVGLTTLGATAQGSGVPWNKNWPAIGTLQPGEGRGGALFGAPLTGAKLDIRLVIPVDIKGIELFPLDYRGTRQISQAEIYIEGRKVKKVDLPHALGKGHYFPLEGHGQNITVLVTGEHPLEDLGNGNKGPNWGGWSRIRVYSSQDVAAMMTTPEAYQVTVNENFVAPTSGTIAQGETKVFGQPRVATGHPKTIWDKQDIEHYKQMLQTSEELRQQYDGLRKAMNQRITMSLGVPQPRKNDRGEYVHISDREVGSINNNLALDIANLGTMYVLSGEVKYAEFAKKLLLAYADAYPNYGVGARPGFSHDPSKVFDQRLGDSTWLIQVARGYDLIYNSPMTDAERRHIEDDLIKAAARFIAANSAHLRGATNWSAIGTCSVLISGVATDDEDLINLALFGINKDRNPKKWWEGEPNARPSGIELHFSEQSISDDGLWSEGAMGYQFMALQAVVADAEILWHRGIDLYRYRDGALKRLFDSPLEYCYPDLSTPAINDSGHGSIVGRDAYLYEYGYRRYKDPKYLLILKQTGKHLGTLFQQFPVSVLYDLDMDTAAEPVEWESINFFGVGYGILRNTTPRGTVSLLMDYGQSGSHDHPDKLNIDIWGFGERLLPDPGSIWYEQPLYRNWFHTTVAHNTLVVDELNQREGGGVNPDQLVYGPAESFAIQRARIDTAYSGVTMDRAVFVTPEYTADLFGAFAQLPRKMDLAWHPVGEMTSTSLDFSSFKFPEPTERGYSELTDTQIATTSDSYKVVVDNNVTTLRLLAAGSPGTQVIIGKGHLGLLHPPTILQRRQVNQTIWANVLDYSEPSDGVAKSVNPYGSLDEGYSLLEVQTDDGVDLCFASYRSGEYNAQDLTTDAQQVFVIRKGNQVTAAYLGGGTSMQVSGMKLQRSEPGLAYIELAETGAYIVGNPSATNTTVTLSIPGIKAVKIYRLDREGRRIEQVMLQDATEDIVVEVPAASHIELALDNQLSVFEYRQEMLRKRMAEQEAAIKAAENAAKHRTADREAAAKKTHAPANTILIVQAENMSGEGGGKVSVTDRKRNTIGKAFASWDALGHWLEYTVDAPADGYYCLGLVYCSEMDNAQRLLQVNGKVVDEYMNPAFPSTGGWANNSDDWRFLIVDNPVVNRPLMFKLNKGQNVIRLTNSNGQGINLDYLVVFSPDVKPTRKMLTNLQAP